jgi:hypothetical protein
LIKKTKNEDKFAALFIVSYEDKWPLNKCLQYSQMQVVSGTFCNIKNLSAATFLRLTFGNFQLGAY